MMPLSPDLVRALYRSMGVRHQVAVEDKRTSPVMRGAADLLARAGIQTREQFARYTTTLGTTIYAPFTPGEPTPGYDLAHQVVILAHELTHVEQFRRSGADFLAGYAMAPSARALYESEAYRAGETVRQFLGHPPTGPDALASHLGAYGVTEADIAVSRAFHASSLASLADGATMDPCAADVMAFVADYGEIIEPPPRPVDIVSPAPAKAINS